MSNPNMIEGRIDMSIKISDLIPDFRAPASQLIANCASRGVRMVPSETLRTPWQQAIYWRQSRSIVQIRAAIQDLQHKGAPFLAGVLDSVGPRNGDEVTHALPGNSWHQWGEALDCFWEIDGKAEWSTTKKVDGLNGYSVYAEEAEKLGLNAGLHWRSFKDSPHVQLRGTASPQTAGMTWAQIDATMKERFSGQGPMAAAFLPGAATAASDPIRLSYVSPNGWRVFETTDHPAAVFRAKMAIDADGAPRAYNSNNAIALDYLANAGRPGNWWALVTDADGNPLVQDANDPAPGFFISTTTLTNPGTDAKKPAHFIDASTIPFLVLPGRRYTRFTSTKPIRLGDLGAVYNRKNGKQSFAIFADTGPAAEIGEGSIALANALGLNGNPKHGGTDVKDIVYVVFPGSGTGGGMPAAQIDAKAKPLFEEWGGLARITSYGNL
jgi:Fungal chitosanase of glycosyl hydrolase group 75/D-alanyl-D-alanine carboxypeptidase